MSSGIPVTDEIQGNLNVRDFSGTGLHGNVLVERNLTVLGTLFATSAGGLAPSGDTTGATDGAAIQAAIGTGKVSVELGAGTFYVNAALLPKSGMRLSGVSYQATAIVGVGCSVIDAGHAQTDNVEIACLELRATGGVPVVTGANCIRWFVHDCYLNQLDGTTSNIWNASPVTVMIECRFARNREQCANGGPAFAAAWLLSSASGATQVNQCSWIDEVCFSADTASQYWYHIAQTGAGVLNECCEFSNIVFEHPAGGMIWLESMLGGLIDNCYSYDSASGTWVTAGFKISKNATGGSPQRTTIRASGRTDAGPVGAGVADILLDSNCLQTTIDGCGVNTGNAPFVIDLGSAVSVNVRNMPTGYTLSNGPTVPARNVLQAEDASTDAVLTVRSTATAPAQTALQVESHATAENALGVRVHGDTANRAKFTSDGKLLFGSGSAASDVALFRGAAGLLQVSTDASAGTFFPVGINDMMELFRAPAGATGQTMSRVQATVATSVITTSGTIYLTAIALPAGITVNNISYYTGTTVKTGGTHGWYVLADSGLVVRAATADKTDASTTWGVASTKYTLATNAFVTTYTGLYYAGIMVANSAGAQPSIAAAASGGGGLGTAPALSGTSSAGQTTPPATDGSVTLTAITGDLSRHHYAFTS